MNGFHNSLKPSCLSFPQSGPRPNAKCVRAANCSRPFACSDIHDGSDIHSMPNAFSTSNNGVMPAQAWREGDKKYSQMLSHLTSPCLLEENLSSLQKSFVTKDNSPTYVWHFIQWSCNDSKIEFRDCEYFSTRKIFLLKNYLSKFNFFDFFRSKPKLTKNGSLQAFGRLCLPRHIHSRCPGWDHHSLTS